MRYEYFVLPYFDQLIQGVSFTQDDANAGCQKLQELLNHYASYGWEYYRTEEVVAHVNPGCVASLFGHRSEAYRYKQIVFRKVNDVAAASHNTVGRADV
jgi:hypothetical protein